MRRVATIVGGVVLALIVLALAVLWLERKPIAERLARDWLTRHGLASSLAVRQLSLTGLSASLRLGPPTDPILTVERVEIGYRLTGPWTVETRKVTFVRPRLKLNWTGNGFDLRALKPLIDELSKPPPPGVPLPDVSIEDGVAVIVTPAGQAVIRGVVDLPASQIAHARARLEPFRLQAKDLVLTGSGASLAINPAGRGLHVSLTSAPASLESGARRATVSTLTLAGDLDRAGSHFVGQARLEAEAPALPGFDAQGASADFTLAHLAATRTAAALDILADGAGRFGLHRLTAAGASANLTSAVRLNGLHARLGSGPPRWSAALAGDLQGRGAFTRKAADGLAGTVPDPALAAAARKALAAFTLAAPRWRAAVSDHGWALSLAAPVRLASASGARLTATPRALAVSSGRLVGGVDIALAGGGFPAVRASLANAHASSAGYGGELSVSTSLSTALVKDARVTLDGRLSGAGGAGHFDLSGCQEETAARLGPEANALTSLAARLCPGPGPLVAYGPAGARLSGLIEDARGEVPSAAVRFQAGRADFRSQANGLAFTLEGIEIADTTKPLRFRPIALKGSGVAGAELTGTFAARTPSGHSLGTLRLRQTVSGGRADIDTGEVAFAPGALQPADLSPTAGAIRNVQGRARFSGWLAWDPAGHLTSAGEASARLPKFTSPAGAVESLAADIRLTRLIPLITAPGQTIEVARVEAVTPLTGIAIRFGLTDRSLSLAAVNGQVVHGSFRLEPLDVPLSTGATVHGALVLDHIHLGELIAASNLAQLITTDAVVDGRIPFEISPKGLTIAGGRLAAIGPGRLSISRQALTGGAKPTGQSAFAQNLAYEAMEDLAFSQLDAALNSQPGDRLGILFHIKGKHAPAKPQRATIAVGDILKGKALQKPLPLPSGTEINLTLDSSLNFGELVRALGEAWRESLGGSAPVQPAKASVRPR